MSEPTVDLTKIEGMSQEDLESLEDEMHAAEVGETTDDTAAASGQQEQPKPEAEKQVAEPAAKPKEEGVQAPEAQSQQKEEAAPADGQPDPELVKHISPPSKWAAERHEKKALQARLETAEEKAAKAEDLETELTQMKGEMAWMKTAIQGKGIELPTDPLETFSDEKITEIRDEFGDELADMFQATKAVLAGGQPAKPAPAPAPTQEAAQPTDLPAQPAPAQQQQQPEQQGEGDQELIKAIKENDELTYWMENSPALWEKSIAADKAMREDPNFGNHWSGYDSHLKQVVEQVKQEVMKGASPDTQQPGQGQAPADSLTGTGGEVPSPTGNSALDRVMAADGAEAQLKVYQSLSPAEKDEVDLAIDI